MSALPLKPEYRPTLADLLAPRWRAAGAVARTATVLLALACAVLVVAVVLRQENAHYRQGGAVPFHFSYRGLYRTTTPPGDYVAISHVASNGRLDESFTVGPLSVPPYTVLASAALPIDAIPVIDRLQRTYPDFVLTGEGVERTNIVAGTNNPNGYQINFQASLRGVPYFGRVVLLLPSDGATTGVLQTMLVRAAGSGVDVAHPVGSNGPLNLPFASFAFGG